MCAIATILPAYAGGQWQPLFADHFDIYPLAPGHDGWIVTNDAIVHDLHPPNDFRWLLTARGREYMHARAAAWADRHGTDAALLAATVP